MMECVRALAMANNPRGYKAHENFSIEMYQILAGK